MFRPGVVAAGVGHCPSDLDQVSRIARQMVGRRGMSDRIGPLTVLPAEGQEQPLAGLDGSGPSPATRELVDTETRKIVDECYTQAVYTLQSHRDQLDRLAHTLLDRESLDADEAYAATRVPRTTRPDFTPPAAPPRPPARPDKVPPSLDRRDGQPHDLGKGMARMGLCHQVGRWRHRVPA